MAKTNYRKETCGGCNIYSFSPPRLAESTKIVNVVLLFEDALKLQAALAESIQRMNRIDQRKIALSVTLAVHRDKSRLTVHSYEV